jgi:predicted nicotinamide N-methyase
MASSGAGLRRTMARAMADLTHKVAGPVPGGMDGLRLVSAPLVPEVRLYLAEDSIVWWARMEAEAGTALSAPFWASAWAGGQAVARYVLDHPETVRGRRVLDVASGSGLVAIAARLAGARSVTANDIDPYSIAAVMLNAKVNRVTLSTHLGDLLDESGGDAELVLVGDLFYDDAIAAKALAFIDRVTARGGRVLVGDPGRGHLSGDSMETVTSYRMPADPFVGAFIDAERRRTDVLRPRLAGAPAWLPVGGLAPRLP